MAGKGQTWNESESYRDPVTLRAVRRLTRRGLYNNTPTYHTGTGFTADGATLIFATARGLGSAICRCEVATGQITQLVDWVPGVGTLDELHKQSGTGLGNGLGVTMFMCLAPHSRWAVYLVGRSLRAVNIDSLAERTLIENLGEQWIAGVPSIDPAETHVLVPIVPTHPELGQGQLVTRRYLEWFAGGGAELRLMRVPLDGTASSMAYQEKGITCAHCPHCPTDADLVLLDRDLPPSYWCGSDRQTTRQWLLRLSDGRLTELAPRDPQRFTVHSAWTWDGQAVVYHGRAAQGGWYLGVIGRDGQVRREYTFPQANGYGHVAAMANRSAIISDGNLLPGHLLWVDYGREQPQVEIIARHNTNWEGMPWQYAHVHPQSDPTGRWISFNACVEKGRADVFVVEVQG